jgi:hypothetical protein
LDEVPDCEPDLVLVGSDLAGEGVSVATERLGALMPDVPIVVLSTGEDQALVKGAVMAGAVGSVGRSAHDDVLAGTLVAQHRRSLGLPAVEPPAVATTGGPAAGAPVFGAKPQVVAEPATREAEVRAHEEEKRAREEEKRAREAEKDKREAEKVAAREDEKRQKEAEKSAAQAAREAAKEAEKQAHEAERAAREAERRVQEDAKRAQEAAAAEPQVAAASAAPAEAPKKRGGLFGIFGRKDEHEEGQLTADDLAARVNPRTRGVAERGPGETRDSDHTSAQQPSPSDAREGNRDAGPTRKHLEALLRRDAEEELQRLKNVKEAAETDKAREAEDAEVKRQ